MASILAAIALAIACDDNADIATAVAKPDAGVDASIEELGRQFLAKRACGDCHQSSDPKDGILTGQSQPRPGTTAYPKNLTPDPDTGIDAWTDEQYITAMREGLDDQGDQLCGTMPKFPDMTDDEGRAIAAYLRSLTPVWRSIPESTCPPIKPKPEQDGGEEGGPGNDAGDASGE
jgi:mono/diheme cytochrome c family protein